MAECIPVVIFTLAILWIWLVAWDFAFPVACPAVLLVEPLVRNLAVKLLRAA